MGVLMSTMLITDRSSFNSYGPKLDTYMAEHINKLPHIDQAREFDLDSSAIRCGGIFIKHRMESVLAVSRLHHHFHLEGNERILVSVENASKSRGKDTRLSNMPVIVKKPQAKQKTDIPYIFRFATKIDGESESLSIIPLEYIDSQKIDPKLARDLSRRSINVLNSHEFLTDLFATIMAQGNIDKLGFQLIFEDEVLTKLNNHAVLHEDNWDRYQEVVYRAFSGDHQATVTSWRFAKPTDMSSKCVCVERTFCQLTPNGHLSLVDGHNQYD